MRRVCKWHPHLGCKQLSPAPRTLSGEGTRNCCASATLAIYSEGKRCLPTWKRERERYGKKFRRWKMWIRLTNIRGWCSHHCSSWFNICYWCFYLMQWWAKLGVNKEHSPVVISSLCPVKIPLVELLIFQDCWFGRTIYMYIYIYSNLMPEPHDVRRECVKDRAIVTNLRQGFLGWSRWPFEWIG